MKSGISKIAALSIVGALALPSVASAAACNNALIKGTYGLIAYGVQGTAEPFEHVNVTRTAIFDGKGKFSGAGWRSIDGVPEEFTTSGKYAVKSDCTVTVDGTIAGKPNIQFGVITGGGLRMSTIRTDKGQNLVIMYEKQ